MNENEDERRRMATNAEARRLKEKGPMMTTDDKRRTMNHNGDNGNGDE